MKSVKVFDLVPTDGHKSFYGKARCIVDDGDEFLKSYETIVACVDKHGNLHRYWNGYSATTARHLNSFLDYCGIPRISKKDWESLEVE